MKRAKASRINIGIHDKNFAYAAERLSSLQFSGPVGLSADDTAAFPSLRPYWAKDSEHCVVIGSVGEPIIIKDLEELKGMIEENKIAKASKVYCYYYYHYETFLTSKMF